VSEYRVIGVEGLPEIAEGDDLAPLIAGAVELEDGDVVVVAQKAVSKAEGRVRALDGIEPSRYAREISGERDPRQTEVILGETARIVRLRPPLLIAETRHGFVCASAGVDASNAPETGTVVLLPEDPDSSAQRILARLAELTGRTVAVLVTDSFGRAWREGTTDIAIGAAGLQVLRNLHGERDPAGYELHATTIAVADEIAGAAELVMGKLSRVPAAVVRGLDLAGSGKGKDLVMPPDRDLFR
jgi:coenzyme F420-0:L-glutamate ligase / coenzyme F420-1:gamma-L-glutamate ligase